MNHYYHIKKKDKKNITREEEAEIEQAAKHYYVLKKFNWLLFQNDIKLDPNDEKKYNSVLQGYYNYYDIFDYMIHIDKSLDIAVDMKDMIVSFYSKCSYENAEKELNSIIKELRSCSVPQLSTFADTLSKWKYEIVNSFIIIDKKTGKRINNGLIENRNKSIKCIKHNSNGYLNWSRFRNRILYTLNDDATFHMYPMFKKEDDK